MAKIFDMDEKLIADKIARMRKDLDELEKLIAGHAPQFPESKKWMLEKEICLNCGEPKAAKSGRWLRGNHESCYRLTYREIKAGKHTLVRGYDWARLCHSGVRLAAASRHGFCGACHHRNVCFQDLA